MYNNLKSFFCCYLLTKSSFFAPEGDALCRGERGGEAVGHRPYGRQYRRDIEGSNSATAPAIGNAVGVYMGAYEVPTPEGDALCRGQRGGEAVGGRPDALRGGNHLFRDLRPLHHCKSRKSFWTDTPGTSGLSKSKCEMWRGGRRLMQGVSENICEIKKWPTLDWCPHASRRGDRLES